MLNTTLCYIEKDSSYLMIHRIKKKNDVNFDKWIGIGGKFESEESPFDCARREIYEETGLTVKKLKFHGIVTFISDNYATEYMHLFTADDFKGEITQDCNEGILEWVKKDKIYDLPIWEGDKIFLDLIEKKAPFFSLTLRYEGDRLISHTLEF